MPQKQPLDILTASEQEVAKDFVERVLQRFNGQLISAVLFGSRARGQAVSGVDMDVAVVLNRVDTGSRREIRHMAVEVWLEYGIYLSTRVWSLSHWHELEKNRTLLYENIRRDGVNLLELLSARLRATH